MSYGERFINHKITLFLGLLVCLCVEQNMKINNDVSLTFEKFSILLRVISVYAWANTENNLAPCSNSSMLCKGKGKTNIWCGNICHTTRHKGFIYLQNVGTQVKYMGWFAHFFMYLSFYVQLLGPLRLVYKNITKYKVQNTKYITTGCSSIT